MPSEGKPESLARRGVVRASGGPLRDVKVELGVVFVLVLGVYFLTLGLDLGRWQELAAVAGAAVLGALWVVLRTRREARRLRESNR